MAHYYLQDAKIWIAQHNLSGDHNEIMLTSESDELDATTFGSGGWRSRIAGLRDVSLEQGGFWSGGDDDLDDVLFARIAAAKVPVTVAPTDGLQGEKALFFEAVHFVYTPLGSVGEVAPFKSSAKGGGSVLCEGTIMVDASAARDTTANSTARQLGAVGATQKLYAVLHVFEVTGTDPTLDVIVQSDNGAGFGTPANQITFGQKTAAGHEYATPVAGAITDDWWRINYTIGGTDSPSFLFAAVIGIQ